MRPLAGLAVVAKDGHPAAALAAQVLGWLGAEVEVKSHEGSLDMVLGDPGHEVPHVVARLVADCPEEGGFGSTAAPLGEATALAGLDLAAAVLLGTWVQSPTPARPVVVDLSWYRAALGLVQPTLAGMLPPPPRPWVSYRAGMDGLVGVLCLTPQDLEDLAVWASLPLPGPGKAPGDAWAAWWSAQLDGWVARWPVERLAAEAQAWRLPWAPVRHPPHRPAPPWRLVARSPGPVRSPTGAAALAGVNVVDLTALWAGPQVTAWLRRLGANVVKIESPLRPDGFRRAGARVFESLNAGKAMRTLHLGQPADDRTFARLLASAHVLVDNFSPRVLPQLGWDNRALWRTNPGLVHVSMPAFGGEGPERYWIGYGPTVEAGSGVAWRAGVRRGDPIGLTVADPLAAGWGLVTVLAALLEARRTGRGLAVEMSQVRALGTLAAAGLTGRGLAGSGWDDPRWRDRYRDTARQHEALEPGTDAVRAPWRIRRAPAPVAARSRGVLGRRRAWAASRRFVGRLTDPLPSSG
jgi:hypothetical protein